MDFKFTSVRRRYRFRSTSSLSLAGVPLGIPETEKLLGVHRWSSTDMFKFAVKDKTDFILSRIGISSKTMAIYDPLGLVQPSIVHVDMR